ncbi:YgaP family membrane protein [Halorussus sp. AFM4]|uniref:YgaP family membrane protein n=1 Tax=Halorussus sp. AFM4 TaxID=3421651 RepID=UPI003EBFA657
MDLRDSVDSRGRLARTLLAAALAVVAIASLRKGKRATGALAGVGALALGYSSTTGADELAETADELAETIDIESKRESESEDVELRCAICGEPIRPGQRRGPDENGETAHEACMERAQ